MKKLFIYSLAMSLLASCTKESTLNDGSTSIEDASIEKIYDQSSYIINGELKTIKVDITNAENPIVLESDDSDLILSIIDRDDEVYYYNPEIENVVLFENGDSYSSFINNKEDVTAIKNKFKSKIVLNNELKAKSTSSKSTNIPNVTIYRDTNYSGDNFSFLSSTSLFYYNDRLHTDIVNTSGINFNDRISSIKVDYAYAEFYEGSPYLHETIIIDSYNYNAGIIDLGDIKLLDITIVDDSGLDPAYVKTAFWQTSFNDKITSLRARADGGRW